MNLKIINASINFNMYKSRPTPDISIDGVPIERENDHANFGGK